MAASDDDVEADLIDALILQRRTIRSQLSHIFPLKASTYNCYLGISFPDNRDCVNRTAVVPETSTRLSPSDLGRWPSPLSMLVNFGEVPVRRWL
jgi:hypothetical protein